MNLKNDQGITIRSSDILNGEEIKALVKNITQDFITIHIPVDNLELSVGTSLLVNYYEDNYSYKFEALTLTPKEAEQKNINITKTKNVSKYIKRKTQRLVIKLDGEISNYNGANKHKCIIVDICDGGLLIAGVSDWKIGDQVFISFILPNGEKFIKVSSRIVWKVQISRELSNYGIQFEAMSEILRKKLMDFINVKLIK